MRRCSNSSKRHRLAIQRARRARCAPGVEEGLELNLLGLTFGIDPLQLSLKLPMVGRIGWPDCEAPSLRVHSVHDLEHKGGVMTRVRLNFILVEGCALLAIAHTGSAQPPQAEREIQKLNGDVYWARDFDLHLAVLW